MDSVTLRRSKKSPAEVMEKMKIRDLWCIMNDKAHLDDDNDDDVRNTSINNLYIIYTIKMSLCFFINRSQMDN